jgi:hypothetical protein
LNAVGGCFLPGNGRGRPFYIGTRTSLTRVIDHWPGGLQSLAAAGAEHCFYPATGEVARFTLGRGGPRPRVIDYWLGGLQSLAAAGAEHCPHRDRGAEGPAPSRAKLGF